MTAEEYLTSHWNKNEIWTHLKQPTHQERLGKCAGKMIGANFVDVGCGVGHSTAIMAGFHPGAWTGIEFHEPTVERARVNFPTLQFIGLDKVYELTGFVFDGVVCSEVIEHVEDPLELISCLWAMTKKVLVVTTPCVRVSDPGHLRLFTEASLRAAFDGIPIEIEQKERFFYVTARRK